MKKSRGKFFWVLLAVLLVLSLTPAAALAEEIDDILGPLTLDSGSVAVGDTTGATVTIRTEDGTLPDGMKILWSVSDGKAASVTPDAGSPDSATVKGLKAKDELTVSAQLYDSDGDKKGGPSSTVIRITDGNAAPAPVASISGETNNITLGPITLEHGSIAVGGTSGVVATIRISGY